MLRALIRKAGVVFTGNVTAGLMDLAAMAVVARSLGPVGLGLISVAQAYVRVVDRAVNFQSWQLVVRYAARCLEHQDRQGTADCLKFGLFLDAASAAGACLLAMALVGVVGPALGWSAEGVSLTRVFALGVIFSAFGTPTGALRLLDKHTLIAARRWVCAGTRVLGCAYIGWSQGSLLQYAWCWIGADACGTIVLHGLAWREVGRGTTLALPMQGSAARFLKQNPGALKFAVGTNLHDSVRLIRELDVIVVEWILSPAAAGVYRGGKDIGTCVAQVVDPFFQVLYPTIAKLAAAGDLRAIRRYVISSALLVGGLALAVWLVLAVLVEPVVRISLGPGFQEAVPVVLGCGGGFVIWGFSAPLAATHLALGLIGRAFWIHLISSCIFLPLFALTTQHWGTTGSGWIFSSFFAIWFVLSSFSVGGALRLGGAGTRVASEVAPLSRA